MHFVTGGAYNGKKKWVKEFYQLDGGSNYEWFNNYEETTRLSNMDDFHSIVVFEGIEQMILALLKERKSSDIREYGRELINHCLAWECSNKAHELIIIGADISKGIVPMDPTERQWRDLTGWFYQDLVVQADRVEQIWYGIGRQLK